MKPAICALCGKSCKDEEVPHRGDWVRFSDYRQPELASLDDPVGMEYFCVDHLTAARGMISKSSQEAIAELRQKYGVLHESRVPEPQPKRVSWWRRIVFWK